MIVKLGLSNNEYSGAKYSITATDFNTHEVSYYSSGSSSEDKKSRFYCHSNTKQFDQDYFILDNSTSFWDNWPLKVKATYVRLGFEHKFELNRRTLIGK